jgi:AcrR family transcriptional regulator
MPRAFTEDERIHIKERLIEAGKGLINRGGTRNLSIDEAARKAGISKGSFYSFFPSKEDFVLSVFESWEDKHRGDLIRETREGSRSPVERLERFFLGALELMGREPGLAMLGYGEVERIMEALPPERVAAHQARDERIMREALGSWLAEGIIDEEGAKVLPSVQALLFAVAIHKEDLLAADFEGAAHILAEALAMRLAPAAHEGGNRRDRK